MKFRKAFFKNKIQGKISFIVLSFLIFSFSGFAQKPLNPIQDSGPKSRIELIRADSLVGQNSLTRSQTFLGNVIFSHRGVLLGCQKAVHNLSSNFIEAFGKVVINQGDTLTITGDTLMYDGNLRFAKVYGKQVILRDKKVTLRTTQVHYSLDANQAYYPVPGVLNQDSSKLSSQKGYYNTKTKYFKYIGDVEVMNPQYVLCTDSLDYDTYSKLAIFKTFTTIKGKNGDLSAYRGKYNIKTRESYFEGRAKVTNEEYSLEGDTLSFDNLKGSGFAIGKVIFASFKDSLVVLGNKGNRDGKTLLTKISGQTLTRRITQNDTLWIAADTLLVFQKNNQPKPDSNNIDTVNTKSTKPILKNSSDLKPGRKPGRLLVKEEIKPNQNKIEIPESGTDTLKIDSLTKRPNPKVLVDNKIKKEAVDTVGNKPPDKKDIEKIIAYGKVKVVRSDFQSVSDSLMYNMVDSTISFYKKPVIWNKANQLEADTVSIFMKNNKLNEMRLKQNSFVIETDTIGNFNQIKGRTLDAFFDKQNELKTIKVEGNGESLYFALDEKNKIIGLNKVQCSSMQFYFAEKKIRQIVFRGQPESYLMPPKEIFNEDLRLEKFEWKKELRPSKNSIVTSEKEQQISQTKLFR